MTESPLLAIVSHGNFLAGAPANGQWTGASHGNIAAPSNGSSRREPSIAA